MASTLAEGNRINPFTTGEGPHQLTGLLNRPTPGAGFIRAEISRTTDMAAGIKKEPSQKRGRIRMMPQNPKTRSPNLIPRNSGKGAAMDAADVTA